MVCKKTELLDCLAYIIRFPGGGNYVTNDYSLYHSLYNPIKRTG